MGFTSYSIDSRTVRANELNYKSADVNKTFVQQKERCAHKEMDSKNISFRECRDSEAHPQAIPIVLALDVTGSMGAIPKMLIADGLPTLMSTVIEAGVPDASLLFLAIGDHEADRYPVQAGQFESGDAELDMWLTRTYLEGGGGGNAGESYPLAWEFAANRVKTDAWDKRKEKGFIFTIGDEPFLRSFPKKAFSEMYGDNALIENTMTAEQLFTAATEKFHVFHISLDHGYRTSDTAWTELMGKHHIQTKDHNDIPNIIASTILKTLSESGHKKLSETAPIKQKDTTKTPIIVEKEDSEIAAML